MAEPSDSSLAFFSKGTPQQWRFIYELRNEAIKIKADQRSSKKGGPEEFIKLDNWFTTGLPKKIHSRKEPHLLYDELVQSAKWRLMMGKYRPKMLDLIRTNTDTSVVNITRKAFKKLNQQKNLQQALTMLVNLKGIGPSTASAILCAGFPEQAPFMSDEGMLSTPGVEATDSTIAEYNNYSEQLRNKTLALEQLDPEYKWTPHKVDQALWIYYLIKDTKPVLLESMPRDDGSGSVANAPINNSTSKMPLDAADDNANVSAPTVDDEESSQDIKEEKSNGTFMNDDSESASVPYSEEEGSQGGVGSCSADSTGGQFGSETSSVAAIPLTNGTSSVTNGNNGATSSGIGEDSNFSDQDSRSGGLLMMTPSEENSVDGQASLDGPPLKKQKTASPLALSTALVVAATVESAET